MPDKQELIAEYDAYYTKNPDIWIDDARNNFAYKAISEHIKADPEKVLDVGCGNGHTITYLSKQWPEAKFTGIDLSRRALEIAHERNPKAEFYNTFIEDFVASKPFDVVVALGVAEHFEDLQAGLTALRNVTSSRGGVCYLEMPNCIGYPDSVEVQGFRRLNYGSRQWEWHLYRESWDREIIKAGFRIEQSLTGMNIFSEFCYLLAVA